MILLRSRGEMDITTVFGTVIEGSNPPESTKVSEASLFCAREEARVRFRGGFEARLVFLEAKRARKTNRGTDPVRVESPLYSYL